MTKPTKHPAEGAHAHSDDGTSRSLGAVPLAAPNCPLCGGPNGCAAVAAGHFGVSCWCQTVTFSADLLARVPAEQQGRACICARCAGGEAPSAAHSASPAP